jgi:hypothetical protein
MLTSCGDSLAFDRSYRSQASVSWFFLLALSPHVIPARAETKGKHHQNLHFAVGTGLLRDDDKMGII